MIWKGNLNDAFFYFWPNFYNSCDILSSNWSEFEYSTKASYSRLLLLVIIQDIMIPPRLILTIDEILWYIFSCCCCYINAVCQNSFRKDWSRFCVCWEDMWGMHRWAALSEWLEAQSRVLHPPGLLLFARKWSKLSGIGMALLTPVFGRQQRPSSQGCLLVLTRVLLPQSHIAWVAWIFHWVKLSYGVLLHGRI